MASNCQRSDETLCGFAASGDRTAEEELVTRYNRLVRICARPYFLAGGDSEDLIQEGMIGLLSAIRGFRPGKESTFHTYAEVCIRNRIRSAARTASRDKHVPLNQSLSLGAILFDETSEAYSYDVPHSAKNPEDALIDREERQKRMDDMRRQLSGFEKTVLEFYLEGFSYHEIALRVNRPVKSVDNAVQRIRRKAAPYLARE